MRSCADPARWMAVTFSKDGLIESISAGAEQIIGYSAQDLVGRPITHIMADQSVFEVPRMMDSAIEWGSWQGEVFCRSRSGNCVHGRGSISPLAGRGNANAGFLFVSVPLRDRERSGGKMTDELGEVGSRLRNLTHELNNPLAVMMGFAQLIMLDTACAGKLRTDMEKLYTEMQRVIHVVEKLHGYAISLQEEQPVAVNQG